MRQPPEERAGRRRAILNDARRAFEQTHLAADELARAAEAVLQDPAAGTEARRRLSDAITRYREVRAKLPF